MNATKNRIRAFWPHLVLLAGMIYAVFNWGARPAIAATCTPAQCTQRQNIAPGTCDIHFGAACTTVQSFTCPTSTGGFSFDCFNRSTFRVCGTVVGGC